MPPLALLHHFPNPMESSFILPFSAIGQHSLAEAGGKNAALAEMFNNLSFRGIRVPDGFAVSTGAYRFFLSHNRLEGQLAVFLAGLDRQQFSNLNEVGINCRLLMENAPLPQTLREELETAYHQFLKEYPNCSLAVRSSATAEDLKDASFAGQHDSFLHVQTLPDFLAAVKKCYVSVFNDRAIQYRENHGFDHLEMNLSCGVQKMIRSDLGGSGVAFTLDPESGFRDVVYINAIWGLGENLVQGRVDPDEILVFKPSLHKGLDAVIKKKTGQKELTLMYSAEKSLSGMNGKSTEGSVSGLTENHRTETEKRNAQVLSDAHIRELALNCTAIEEHFDCPMDIEWALDGLDHQLYILQARPETVHSQKKHNLAREFTIHAKSREICSGKAVGHNVVSGRVCIVRSPQDAGKVRPGDILVAETTNPDWNPLLKKAVGIITSKGGRTSHASIVARELGIPAVVGTGNATEVLKDGQMITLSCAEPETGKIYDGVLDWESREYNLDEIPETQIKAMLILSQPDRAMELSFYPNSGVGLLRMEFIINNCIAAHPMALTHFSTLPEGADKIIVDYKTRGWTDKRAYFVDTLARSVAQVAAAFFPKEVIVRMSDFKTNEYSSLPGGKFFEPVEENPMIGFRGASRYYNAWYREGFRMECEAMKYVREKMGFQNVKLMIPFCRTADEGKKVLALMGEEGLVRGKQGLEIYAMVEIPANVLDIEELAAIFDGFSIGSNDLTQLTLGIDRDSNLVSHLFDERQPSVRWMISTAIRKSKLAGVKIGFCGQAPSDYPEYAEYLVEEGIDSISFNPDSLLNGIRNIHRAEEKLVEMHD
jgi:pyruvate,water dikinase